jgi:hypothetical protein
MNATRGVFWGAGFLLGIAGAAIISEDLFPGARPTVAGVLFLTLGIVGEILAKRQETKARPRVRDVRPPDGRVDLAALAGVRSEPNLHDARFARFVALDDASKRANPAVRTPSSPPLLGRVVIVSLFLGKDGRSWPDVEIAGAHEALTRAGLWLEREAARHGAAMNIELADTYFTHDDAGSDDVAIAFQADGDDIGPFAEGAGVKAFVDVTRAAASSFGFRDAKALFDAIEGQLDADVTVWLVHPRQAGRSFALPRENSEWESLSLAVCYPREASFPERLTGSARVDPVTIVHELLHLFGASDKYNRSLREYPSSTVTRREVMRLDETQLARLRIDPSTAREIGWVQ